jgi:pantoate--beta-alanine ligase
MGALHKGHMSLVSRSLDETDSTTVSIYVNPTQFNNENDLDKYPSSLANDLDLLKSIGVSAVFVPSYDLLYPDDFTYEISEKRLSRDLCGASRPGHFTGVLTVVMKLLNLVKPQKAFFGEKDFQQLALIKGMAEAFFLDTEIVGCPIVREADGLAMSSRNLNLSNRDRVNSVRFNKLLKDFTLSDGATMKELSLAGFEVDYVVTKKGRRFGAVVMGVAPNQVRLIDNVEILE